MEECNKWALPAGRKRAMPAKARARSGCRGLCRSSQYKCRAGAITVSPVVEAILYHPIEDAVLFHNHDVARVGPQLEGASEPIRGDG